MGRCAHARAPSHQSARDISQPALPPHPAAPRAGVPPRGLQPLGWGSRAWAASPSQLTAQHAVPKEPPHPPPLHTETHVPRHAHARCSGPWKLPTHSSCRERPWTVFQERDSKALKERFLWELRQRQQPGTTDLALTQGEGGRGHRKPASGFSSPALATRSLGEALGSGQVRLLESPSSRWDSEG